MKWNQSILINSLLLIVISWASWSCQDDDNDIVDRNYQLVWEDNFSGPAGQAQAEQQLTSALGNIFALAESYPDLKANQNFLRLQADLSDIENKLAAARRFFNNAVQEYNAAIQQFPAVLFAGMFGFKERGSFDVGEVARESLDAPVQVKF
jgi:LemA protein